MAQADELLGYAREHEARVAHDGEQHLAKGLGLAGVETARRRPVAGQPEFAEPL